MQVTVVIPTLNARELLTAALESLVGQTRRADVVVVDNGSTDGTAELVRERFPHVRIVRNETNLGFGRAINRVGLVLDEGEVLVLVNNDVVCEPQFLERICAPFERGDVGMVAGVLVQPSVPARIDSAGIELDVTLRAWDYLWNEGLERLEEPLPAPVGPCGGAAAYRLRPFRELGGFDETLFAYWEDVDLALRFREAGWRCALAER
ncbi:MAG: glycosyltransferase family 2 protein, partial [Actinomycetota bacterium]|nr:glycosyltransferase family 2 protein [Actinomycetota bacterium]